MRKADVREQYYRSAELRRLQRLAQHPHFDWNRAGEFATVGFVLGLALMYLLLSL